MQWHGSAMHARMQMQGPKCNLKNYRVLYAKTWQNAVQQSKCMQKWGCSRATCKQWLNATLMARYACNNTRKDLNAVFKNMQGLSTMQNRYTNKQQLTMWTDMQFRKTVGLLKQCNVVLKSHLNDACMAKGLNAIITSYRTLLQCNKV